MQMGSAATMQSIEAGIATSCSLMAPCPWASHAMHLLRQRPEIPLGIHLTLFCDTTHYGWGPLTAKDRVPSLLTETGTFSSPDAVPELLAQARLDEVELEFRAQVRAVLDAELMPSHLDRHCLADGGRDDIFDMTAALAEEHGLAVRVWREPGRQKLRARGLPVDDHELMDSFRLDLDGKPARYARLLRPGMNEWAVHAGLGNEEVQAVDGGWRVRSTDYEFPTSSRTREILQQEGIVLIDYRAVHEVWSRITGTFPPGSAP